MARNGGRQVVVAVAALAVAGPGPAWSADVAGERRPTPRARVELALPLDNVLMRLAVNRASLRLRRPKCQRVFSRFFDESDQPLRARLDARGLTGERYLGLLLFREGSRHAACDPANVLAFTSPSSQVESICSQRFFAAMAYDSRRVEAIVIHETLHKLGLGENPPSSSEITRSVIEHCL